MNAYDVGCILVAQTSRRLGSEARDSKLIYFTRGLATADSCM